MTILLTTPYLDEASLCQRVALLSRGRLLALDAPEALRGRSRGAMVELLATPRRRAAEALRAMAGVAEVESFGERLHASLPDVPSAESEAAARRLAEGLLEAGIEVEAARAIAPSLEDVFISLIRSSDDTGRAAWEGRGWA
ncbi:MAG: hypothetical protein HZA60_00595 [Deltaproteobacteria bacterium]|nr:hypothetical protein [Deltaproteobacteria bacterium]